MFLLFSFSSPEAKAKEGFIVVVKDIKALSCEDIAIETIHSMILVRVETKKSEKLWNSWEREEHRKNNQNTKKNARNSLKNKTFILFLYRKAIKKQFAVYVDWRTHNFSPSVSSERAGKSAFDFSAFLPRARLPQWYIMVYLYSCYQYILFNYIKNLFESQHDAFHPTLVAANGGNRSSLSVRLWDIEQRIKHAVYLISDIIKISLLTRSQHVPAENWAFNVIVIVHTFE